MSLQRSDMNVNKWNKHLSLLYACMHGQENFPVAGAFVCQGYSMSQDFPKIIPDIDTLCDKL